MSPVEREWKISVFKLRRELSWEIFSYNFIGKGGWNWFVVKVEFSISFFQLSCVSSFRIAIHDISSLKYEDGVDEKYQIDTENSMREWEVWMWEKKVLCIGNLPGNPGLAIAHDAAERHE